MSKNEVRPDSVDPRGQNDLAATTEKTSLGGPIPHMGYGPNPCRLQLSHEALKAAGMGPNYEVEVVARPGEIVIKVIGAPKPSPWDTPRPANHGLIDELWSFTKEREARLKMAREGIPYDPYGDEPEDSLSDEQRNQEAL